MCVSESKVIRYILIILLSGIVLTGCGRKAAPMPPGIPELPPVTQVDYKIDGGTLTLSWEPPKGQGSSILAGYIVSRSVVDAGGKECSGCPVMFERVAKLTAGNETYVEGLEKGNRYIYKVIAYSKHDSYSHDSKLVRFTY